MYDVLGKNIYSRELREPETVIDISTWNPGIYLVQLKNAEGKVYQGKVVKM